MKKRLSLLTALLVILTALPVLSSCGGNGPGGGPVDVNSDETLPGETETTADPLGVDDLDEKDFEGREFIILVNPDPSFRHFYDVCVEGMNGELVNDAVYKRNIEVEERFNVRITDRQDSAVGTSVKKNVQAGTVDFNAVWTIITDHCKLAQENMFIDFYKVPRINTEKYYWDQNVVRDFTVGGKLYGLMGDISTSASVFTHLLGLNKTLAQENDIDVGEIYQTVRDGKWTLDKLYSIIKDLYRDLDGDGTRNYADVYGFGVSPAIANAAFSASGEKWVSKDARDEFILTLPSSRIDAVYSKIAEIVGDEKATIATWNIGKVEGDMIKGNTYEYVYYDKFINNTVLFADIDVGIVMDYRQLMDSDFGVVPLPKFEESQPGYSVYAFPFYPMLSIPSTYAGDNEALDFIGTVIEGLASASYRILTPAFYDTAFKTKFTRDEESIEMLDIVLRSRIYDMMNIYNFGGIDSGITAQVQTGKINLTSLFEKNRSKAEDSINKLVEAYASND